MEHSAFLLKGRQNRKLTQAQLGESLGCYPQYISAWESGRGFPDLSLWSRYASIFKVDLDSFIAGEFRKKNDYCDIAPFNQEKFSANLKRLRRENNLTKNDLAKMIGVTAKDIKSWEKSSSCPSLQAFLSLCNLYHLNVNELYFAFQIEVGTEKKNPIKKRRIFLPIILPIIIVVGAAIATVVTVTAIENQRAREEMLSQTFVVTWLNYDGTVLETDKKVHYGTTPTYNGSTPRKESDLTTTYEFSGWSPSIEATYKDTTYVATFTTHAKARYTVHLDPNGAELDINELMFYDDEELVLPTLSILGYQFMGWFDENNNKIDSPRYDYKKDLNLTAKWEIIYYSISYVLEGGSCDELINKYTIEDEVILPTPTLSGHKFEGWFDENDNKVIKIEKGTTGNIRLIAKWSVL